MEILQLIAWVLIIIAALRTVGLAKSSGRALPRATKAALWVLSIAVPVIAQAAAVAILAPPLRVTISLVVHRHLWHAVGKCPIRCRCLLANNWRCCWNSYCEGWFLSPRRCKQRGFSRSGCRRDPN